MSLDEARGDRSSGDLGSVVDGQEELLLRLLELFGSVVVRKTFGLYILVNPG